jgi:hypothetical protein
MKIKIARIITSAAIAFGCALNAAAQQPVYQVKVLYVIPQGQTAKPQAADALGAIMAIVQQHYLQQFGVTFELASPLVTQVNSPYSPQVAVDWSTNLNFINAVAGSDYNNNQNVIVTVLEGTTGPAGGSLNVVKMTGDFWNSAYNTYLNKPWLLPLELPVWSQAMGLAYGLMHSEDTKACLANHNIFLGPLPSTVMHQSQNLGSVYNYPFLQEEKNLLLDPGYYPDCRPFQGDRPHASLHFKRTTVQPYPIPTGRNVHLVQFGYATGDALGTYFQTDPYSWVEQNAVGQAVFFFEEQGRDDWSVYLYDSSRGVGIQLDLFRQKVVYSTNHNDATRRDLYDVRYASAGTNGRLAKTVFFGNSRGEEVGKYVWVPGGQWIEYALPGITQNATFNEVGRDDWSIYLWDPSRNANIRIDLFTGKVMYRGDGESSERVLYNVLLANDTVASVVRNPIDF